jgi:hypothetical protein
MSSPATFLTRPHTRSSGTYARPQPSELPAASSDAQPSAFRPDSVPPAIHIEDSLHYTDKMKSSPSPPTTLSPSPALRCAPSVYQRRNFRFFGRSTSAHIATSKPQQRKRLVKKSVSQPTFEIVSPISARLSKVAEVEAEQLGLQLAEAVAAIKQGSTNVKLARVSDEDARSALNSPAETEKGPTRTSNACDQPRTSNAHRPPTKRWSHAPLLPELDFGSFSSASGQLFEPETHEPPPKAKIYVAALSDIRSGSASEKYTSKDPSRLTYRCDIHAQNGASHQSVDQACQKVVTNAGGRILNSYFYPGGFLYSLPTEIPEPITSCELPTLGAKIGVEGWTTFPEPGFNGLRMHPPDGRLGTERPVAMSEMEEALKSRQNNDLERVDAWVHSEGAAVTMGLMDEDNGKMTGKGDEEGSGTTHKAVEIGVADATPTRKATLARSLKTIRRRASEATRTITGDSSPPKKDQSPGNISDNRYTVVLDGSGSDSESGAEEWESVRSKLDSVR